MARRWYLPNTEPAKVTVTQDSAWQETASFVQRRMTPVKKTSSDSLATTAVATTTPSNTRLHRQYVSDPMSAGQVFDTNVTYKAQIQALESGTNDNAYPVCGIRIVSKDGSIVRHTVLAVAPYGIGTTPQWTEFNTTTARNITYLDGDAGTGSYTTMEGDRLVVEFGHDDNGGAGISVTARWGTISAGGDLPEDQLDTGTTLAPWFECSMNVTFLEYNEDFDVSPDNTTLTANNTNATTLTGSPVSDSGRTPAVGTFSAMFTISASTGAYRLDWLPAISEAWFRFYLQMDTLPPAVNLLFLLRNGASTGPHIRVNTDGTLQMRNEASSTIDTSATALAVDVWNRIELHVTTTRFEGRIYTSPNEHSAAAVEDETAFGGTVSVTTLDNFALGVNTSATWTIWLDAVKVRTDNWVGSGAPFSYPLQSPFKSMDHLVRAR